MVKIGDTLYGIARSFYPKSNRSQAKLRKDIINLNQNAFANGSRGLFIGLKLHLPPYAASISSAVSKPQLKPQPKPESKVVISSSTSKLSEKNGLLSAAVLCVLLLVISFQSLVESNII